MLGWPCDSEASPGDACVAGFEGGQEAKKMGKLFQARSDLRLCIGSCPDVLAAECRSWLKEVEGQIGRLVVSARAATPGALEAAEIRIDGQPMNGTPQEVEPGVHRIEVTAQGYVPVQRTVDVGAGATVQVEVTLSPVRAASQAVPSIILASTGLLALVGGASLIAFGKDEENRLAKECSPRCDPEVVAPIERAWVAGGVALGLGALAAGASLSLWLTSSSKSTNGVLWRGWVSPAGSGGLTVSGEF
ncbi:MAG: PEGA domain-containing protein [Polyangiaceae bacterium]